MKHRTGATLTQTGAAVRLRANIFAPVLQLLQSLLGLATVTGANGPGRGSDHLITAASVFVSKNLRPRPARRVACRAGSRWAPGRTSSRARIALIGSAIDPIAWCCVQQAIDHAHNPAGVHRIAPSMPARRCVRLAAIPVRLDPPKTWPRATGGEIWPAAVNSTCSTAFAPALPKIPAAPSRNSRLYAATS
jgi:hypothetical protein